MTANRYRDELARIRGFDQLIAFLRDRMDWPIESGDFEEWTFDYTPEELGIDSKNAAKIQEIRRMRPLTANQPWGIFFVRFEPKQLPVVALRRILSQVTLKKRTSTDRAERQAWAADDLLFISNYGAGDDRQISFAHFAPPLNGRDLPTLKVLGWNDRDTALHLDAVAAELTDRLSWPADEGDIDSWRSAWRSAFTLGHREVITSARTLAVGLARLAGAIRARVGAVLAIESARGPVTKLMKAFREALLHDLSADGFADMYAQTIAYGLLSTRIADPQRATADNLAGHVHTSPFLSALLHTFLRVGGRKSHADGIGIDFDELGTSEVVEMIDSANMEAVLRDFGDRNPREDPVIHFYELFLKEYDAEKRMERGVFYTPRPVVSYIVRSLDSLLRTEFGLADGLADTTTWAQMAGRFEALTIPEGVAPDQDFVRILDPATGTGTFLVEVIDVISRKLKAKWQSQGHGASTIAKLWTEYVRRHLLTRLHGYELLMAPYAIAHLKIGLKLYETGYRFASDERARVYLTNSLEPAQDQLRLPDVDALAREAQAVDEAKRNGRFTVVLGNPPYSGHSANKGEWIRNLLRPDNAAASYFAVDGGPLDERNPKWLNDDYVKFLRLAQWTIDRTGRGLLGFITNHSYLDNPTFRGMRESLAESFPRMFLLDLHGNAKKKERAPDGGPDENVFDILQGVAVGLFAKPVMRHSPECRHADLWGPREPGTRVAGKYTVLGGNDVISTEWDLLNPKSPLRLFIPRDDALLEEYEAGWKLTDIFPINSVGIVTARDKLAIQWTPEDMARVAADFAARPTEAARKFYNLGKDARDWQVRLAQADVRSGAGDVCPILYRPFDTRYTFYTGRSRGFICMPRPKVMRHMLGGTNLGLSSTRTTEIGDGWEHVFASRNVIQHHTVSLKEVNYLLPLYTHPTDVIGNLAKREPNLAPSFTRQLASAVDGKFDRDAGDRIATFEPEDVFHYLYAVLHSPGYRLRYADFLKSDFPRAPLPGSRDLFTDLGHIGARLVSLHLLEAQSGDATVTFPVKGGNTIERVRYTPSGDQSEGRVWINSAQYFAGVTIDEYGYAIGGYRPAEKWLKDRKGRRLSSEDINHYCMMVAALAETRRRMADVDAVIDQYGGWPAAFQSDEPAAPRIIPFRPPIVEPDAMDRYVTCVPLFELKAAAGGFGDPQHIDQNSHTEWVRVSSRRLRPGMFVAQIVGRSMEPSIPDGSWCLFRSPVQGTRQGKTVLVELRGGPDPDTGERYTVKRYTSERTEGDADGDWRHTRITLRPTNPNYKPIILSSEEDDTFRVIAEFLEVVRGDT